MRNAAERYLMRLRLASNLSKALTSALDPLLRPRKLHGPRNWIKASQRRYVLYAEYAMQKYHLKCNTVLPILRVVARVSVLRSYVT